MKQIAIINLQTKTYRPTDYDLDNIEYTIATSITDWSDVTDDEFNALCAFSEHSNFLVVVRKDNEQDFIQKTVKSWIERVKSENAKKEKEEAEWKALNKEREDKKLKAKEKREKKLLEKLKDKYKE